MSSNDYDVNPTNKFKNLSFFNNNPKVHPVIEIAHKKLVVLDSELVLSFRIQEGDLVLQEADRNCIRLAFRKNLVNSEDQGGY